MADSVYIETSVPSAYVSRRRDPASVHWRAVTRRWWHEEAGAFRVITSEATIAELSAQAFPGQEEALALVEDLPDSPSRMMLWRSPNSTFGTR